MRQMMQNAGRFFVFCALAMVLASACNNGGGQSGVLIVVDGRGLTQAQLASVTNVWIYIDGDGDGSRMQYDFKVNGLPSGMYQDRYHPQNRSGKLTITAELHVTTASTDKVIATNQTIVDIHMGNQVMATIMLTGTTGAGGAGGTMGTAGAGGMGGSAGVGSATGSAGTMGAGGVGAAGGAVGTGTGGTGTATGGAGGGGPGQCAGVTACLLAADGCCPAGCTGATDADCAVCGNSIVEQGETCDPLSSCPATCAPKGCQLYSLAGAGTCQATCLGAGLQTQCANGDGCCPTGCTTANDSDCQAGCGNGVLEGAETCEVAPAGVLCSAITCDDKDACTVDSRLGMNSACDVACAHSQITGCVGAAADGCCPAGCNATNDPDCAVVCGNGVVEAPAELCDKALAGSCPTACPQQACVLPDLLNGGTCKAACVDQGRRQTACVLAAKDGCCPGGCNANNDADCVAVCGNGVLEAGELCESTPATPTCASFTCNDGNACTKDTPTGSAAACNLKCTSTAITTCVDGDGCCAPGCTGLNDNDCAPPNDTCANAVDISAGGDFAFSLFNAKPDLTQIKCGGAGGEVFFTFKLPVGPATAAAPLYYGYFDVYDPSGKAVNVSLELYQGSCPADGSTPVDCASPTTGQQGCATTQLWPRLMPANNLTGGTQYILAARTANGVTGRYTLRFHRIPAACAAAGVLASGTPQPCNSADLYGVSCGTAALTGAVNYYVEKCPAPGLTVDTCGGRAAGRDTVLQINRGSVDLNAATGKCTVMSAVAQICNDTSATCGTAGPMDATLTNAERGERGLFTVVVGMVAPTRDSCTAVTLSSTLVQ